MWSSTGNDGCFFELSDGVSARCRKFHLTPAIDGNHREVIPTLYELFKSDEHAAVRQTAALALADFGEKAAAPESGV